MTLAVTDKDSSCIKVTGDTATSAKIIDRLVFVKSIIWYLPTNAAHLVNLIDKNGGPIITMIADANGDTAAETQQWTINSQFEGIYSDDMDSGTLFIYVR